MTTAERLIEALKTKKHNERQYTLDFVPSASTRPFRATISADGVNVRAQLEDLGEYGVLLRSIRISAPLASNDADVRERQSELVRRFAGFETPHGALIEWEVDAAASHAVLRTGLVTTGDGNRSFFELGIFQGCDVELTHHSIVQTTRVGRRTDVNLAMEQFQRLLDDLVNATSAQVAD